MMDGIQDKDYAADYLALKAANDQLRERGLRWLLETLEHVCAEINRRLMAQAGQTALQIGRQEWQFKVGNSTMIGQRLGVRYRDRTLIVEAGWPREPEHGHVPDQGLARGRISLVEAKATDELILRHWGEGEAAWYVIENKKLGEVVTEARLRAYLQATLAS
jgi:hypothetical protein